MRLSERISQGSTSNLLESINTNLKESNNDIDIVSYNLTDGGYSNNANTVYGKLSDDTAYVYYPEMNLIEIYDEVPIELLHILYYNSENEDELPEDEYQRLVKEYQDAHLINTIHDGPLFDKLHDKYYADDEVEEVYSDLDETETKKKTKWKSYVKQMAKLDCEYGHPIDSDDFESFYKILKDDNFSISEEEAHKAFDYYFECFDYYLERLNEKQSTLNKIEDKEVNSILNENTTASKYAKFCKRMELNPEDLDEVLEALDNLEGMDGDASGEYQEIREYIYNDLMK